MKILRQVKANLLKLFYQENTMALSLCLLSLLLCCLYVHNVNAFVRSPLIGVSTLMRGSKTLFQSSLTPPEESSANVTVPMATKPPLVTAAESVSTGSAPTTPIDESSDDITVAVATKPRVSPPPPPAASPVSTVRTPSPSTPTDLFSESNQLSFATVVGALLAGEVTGLALEVAVGSPELELAPSVTAALAAGLAIKYVTDPPNEVAPALKSYLGVPVLAAQRAAAAAVQKKVDQTVQEIVSIPVNVKTAIVRKTDETVAEVRKTFVYVVD